MKKTLIVMLLSISLLLLGCSSKSANLHTSADTTTPTTTHESSIAARILHGSLVLGMGAVMLTTAAVVILLLVPKAQIQR
jgi:uncharacterized protein YcfL